MASTRSPLFVAPSAIIPLDQRPSCQLFTLPDLTPIEFAKDEPTNSLTVRIGKVPQTAKDGSHARFPASVEQQQAQLSPLLRFTVLQHEPKVNVSDLQVNAERRTKASIWQVESLLAPGNDVSYTDFWAALYAFWVANDQHYRQPIRLAESIANRQNITRFLLHTGLAYPSVEHEDVLLLIRSTFWQGAGASVSRSWLQNPIAHPTEFGTLSNAHFPLTQSFTTSDDPPVMTTHPVRPPKPLPGTIIYSRYVHAVKQQFQLTVLDWRNDEHFSHYAKWQNSDRVNHGWRERGDDEHHKRFLQGRENDAHTMGIISSWNGEYSGYCEASWSKEDGMSAFVGGMDDYDQGTHSLVGEERFRGRHRFAHQMISLKHFCFLREPRTVKVIGEPRFDLPIIPLLSAYLPQSHRKEIELPHKRAVFFILHRDRFFSEGMFY